MKKTQKNILATITVVSLTLVSTGCAPKNPDGTYHSVYSYHPYNKINHSMVRSSETVEIATYIRPSTHYPEDPSSKNSRDILHDNRYKFNPYTPKKQIKIPYQRVVPNYYAHVNQLTKPVLNNSINASLVNRNIENTAKSLLGTDYKYGANGPYQYDCSSFTKYVFARQGITLPRVSKDQANIGKFVTARELKKGDLIFFDSKKSSKVSHVGIYLGGGNFIHASSVQDKVAISNLSSSYYKNHFKWGRRVTNASYARR